MFKLVISLLLFTYFCSSEAGSPVQPVPRSCDYFDSNTTLKNAEDFKAALQKYDVLWFGLACPWYNRVFAKELNSNPQLKGKCGIGWLYNTGSYIDDAKDNLGADVTFVVQNGGWNDGARPMYWEITDGERGKMSVYETLENNGLAFMCGKYIGGYDQVRRFLGKPCDEVIAFGQPGNGDFKDRALKAHNKYRSKVAKGDGDNGTPGAAYMARLTWDDEIAKTAQAWTERCGVFDHDKAELKSLEMGENLAMGDAFSMGVARATYLWYEEVKDATGLDYSKMPENWDKGVIGHYTQVIWGESTKVGCGQHKCNESAVMISCRYKTPGNMIGAPVFPKGEACSLCDGQCTDGLCDGPKKATTTGGATPTEAPTQPETSGTQPEAGVENNTVEGGECADNESHLQDATCADLKAWEMCDIEEFAEMINDVCKKTCGKC